jgi:hypothetical protein
MSVGLFSSSRYCPFNKKGKRKDKRCEGNKEGGYSFSGLFRKNALRKAECSVLDPDL